MTFAQMARANTPNVYRKPYKAPVALPGSNACPVVFEGLPLVKKLLEMGRKAEAVALYHKLKGTA